MPVLPNAPLIEAIFEMRWGEFQNPSPDEQRYNEKLENSQLLPGQFSAVARNEGYASTETLTNNPPIPFLPRFRYRKTPVSWPCFQIGTGLFTANQIRDGYSGASFKATVIHGFEMLENALPNGINGLPLISIELKYQDGLLSEQGVTREFVKSNLEIAITPPLNLLKHPSCDEGSFGCNHFDVENKIRNPDGVLKISMAKAKISNKPGIVLTSSVLTGKEQIPGNFSVAMLDKWFDEAHAVLKHAFENIFTLEAHRGFGNE